MKILYLLTILLYAMGGQAQTPSTLNYQGIARNAAGAPLVSTTIGVRLSIKDATSAGNTLYSETKSVTTNAFGLYTIVINDGAGMRTGNFNGINWVSEPRYIQTEIDQANAGSFSNLGTELVHSVPFALNAVSAKNLDGAINAQNGDILEYENGNWVAKPKPEKHMVFGFGGSSSNGNGGAAPTSLLRFIGPAAIVTIAKNNPTITISLMKPLGSIYAAGAVGLTLNLGYRKIGETEINEFNVNHRSTGLRVAGGTRVPFHLSGTYQTSFLPGETYEIGIVGMSTNSNNWNDNGYGMGYVEVSY